MHNKDDVVAGMEEYLHCEKASILVTIHHISGAEGIMIQNGGKQDIFQQLQGWILAF